MKHEQKKKRSAFTERRAGDAITGGVMASFYKPASTQASMNLRFLQGA